MHADNRQQLLTQTVAEFFDVETLKVNRTFPLSGPRMQGSLPRYALDAAIRRRVGVAITAVHKAGTFGELEDELLGRAPESKPVGPAPTGEIPPSRIPLVSHEIDSVLACGVDMERVDALPQADDVWEHPFYGETFTRAEIAYCLSRENPAEHFAARWCAKEAVKKCHSQWLEAGMAQIEVVLDEHGAPTLWSVDGKERQQLPVAVSLSHTAEMAIAMVVRGGSEAQQQPLPASEPRLPPPSAALSIGADLEQRGDLDSIAPAKSQKNKKGSRVVFLFALASCVLAGWALWRTF